MNDILIGAILLFIIFPERHYIKWHSEECHSAECHSAKVVAKFLKFFPPKFLKFVASFLFWWHANIFSQLETLQKGFKLKKTAPRHSA